jgi:hypothetical protein
MFDRGLLAKRSRCAWKVLNLYLTQAVPYDGAKTGAVVAMQSFGLRLVDLRLGEHHSKFNVYYGKAIWPHNEDGLENLARGTCPP